ncbi:MAG: STAS/SEC14 domain-containing protein [Acidimicrobiia bacterium]
MIETISGLPSTVIGFRVLEQITAEDYKEVLSPVVDALIERGEDVRIVIEFPQWTGMTVSAVWEDMKMGVERFTKWKRIALVTDVDWMRHATNLFGWMTPGDVKTFALAERDDAIAWAAAD